MTDAPINEITQLRAENCELKVELQNALAELRFLRGQTFARKSEKVSPLQLPLFNEAEASAEGLAVSEGENTSVAGHERRKKRKPISDHTPLVEHRHELPEKERHCEGHGPLELCGEVVKERLEYIPARCVAHRHHCAVYRCPVCEAKTTAPVDAPEPIPGSIATPSLLASIAAAKYVDHMPLYRQEKRFERDGIFISRTTLATWMIRVGEMLLPLWNLMRDELLSHDVVQMDETPVQVLSIEGKSPTSRSYMWVMAGGTESKIVTLFGFDPSRGQDVPLRLLDGFRGFLQVDGYEGYNKACEKYALDRVGCLMHIRRRFFEAEKRLKAVGGGEIARCVLAMIRELYQIEEKAKAQRLDAASRKALRDELSRPLLERLEAYARRHLELVPPKSATGEALSYCLSEWSRFIRYLDDGRLEIDNGRAERAIRPFAQGRRNWLFADTRNGAEASAVLYSLTESAKANGREPFRYLESVLSRIGGATTVSDLEELLPWALPA